MSVLTFLFTDIEGSTRRWEADADAMRVALETHNKVLRDAVEANDGKVFNYTGDGMCAVFHSPRSAVDAAVDAQRTVELPVRMGIASGEAELRGDDYFGAVLNRTARVMAAGHGGQILIDGATVGLLNGVDLIPLGSKRLRDIANPVTLFQVQADGLRTEFPPLKTADPARGNLRPRNTTFIGREAELVELEALFEQHQLITLTGVGGVGKTRLALELGTRLADNFSEGVWVIELAAVGDPTAVPDAVAAALGIAQQPGMSLTDSVAAALDGRSQLLIIDNCEHVLDAAADVIEAILARSETTKVVATSREGVRVEDEQLWPVPSLDISTGLDSSAVALFVDRAQAVARGVPLTPHGAIVEICQRLDGIPLAIELAASRLTSMSVQEVRDRLDDRFRLLVGSRRGLERHQTLRHAVQWSYDLLEDVEKALLARCSVFAGGFILSAACAVASSDDELATLDILDALVRKSLLATDRSSALTRFSMLETIRQFAEEQLVVNGEADHARSAHARHFARRMADVLEAWRHGPRQREAYEWFTVELANLRIAFRWAADHDELDTAAAIAVDAAFLGYLVEQWEPVTWAEELIPRAKAVNHPRLAQLYLAASYCAAVGRVHDFLAYAEHARAAIESGQFDAASEELESAVAAGYNTAGRPDHAVEWCRATITRNPGIPTHAHAVLVVALAVIGVTDEAIEASNDFLAVAQSADNPSLAGALLLAYGWARRHVDSAAAYEALRQAWTLAEESGNRQQSSITAGLLAGLAANRGELTEAFDYIGQTIRYYHASGTIELMHVTLGLLAALLDRLGHHEPAAIISGFAGDALARASFPEVDTAITHLREVLGDRTYESLGRVGTSMTNAAMATYAFEQIEMVRADLQQPYSAL
ncbi:putative ATPase [Mycobacterium sp. OAS707]|uniref:adenylate/guanylate cyclase domain-containing protein n=1 Tax=Mycobacterium sp. OAS707 TaxID=2663822 RepID=UPI00178AA33F|nr:adenylate/guanylate cyclase domain-containing protein [Mycobacterium sp. OAS707]MBE1550959.1 putative ATPase [Mycobacterium sp. OAS707]